jgi:ABC-type multidrug transport system fused ATPase/permease subunit
MSICASVRVQFIVLVLTCCFHCGQGGKERKPLYHCVSWAHSVLWVAIWLFYAIILFSLLVIWCLGPFVLLVETVIWLAEPIVWLPVLFLEQYFFSYWILLSEIGRNKLWKLESNQKIFKKSNKFTWQRQKSEGKLNKNSWDKAQTMPLFRVYTQVSLERRGGWKIPKRKQRHLFFSQRRHLRQPSCISLVYVNKVW